MYGWLLESVQYFVVEEFGEEIWETILQQVGAKNTVFNPRQQYPDAFMLDLASTLARLTEDPKTIEALSSVSPSTRIAPYKPKPTWRSSSVNTDGRSKTNQCIFTSTNALTAETKKEIEAYNSSEEINPLKEENWRSLLKYQRKSAGFKVDDFKPIQIFGASSSNDQVEEESEEDDIDDQKFKTPAVTKFQLCQKPKMSVPEEKKRTITPVRKTSCTLAIDVYKRNRADVNTSVLKINEEKRNVMRQKFKTPEQAMLYFGRCFVKFFTKYKYDTMIRATGRYFCTFLQSVDGIHQRMRFTYPQMLSPTMQLTRTHKDGAELVYSSTRSGFAHYLIGQLHEIAENFFSLKLKVTIMKESVEENYNRVVLKLEFDNSDYVQSVMLKKNLPCKLAPVPASLLLQLFPFGIMLNRKMKIIMAGDRLVEAWGGLGCKLVKREVTEIFRLRKPNVAFTWDKVVSMQTIMFELELIRESGGGSSSDSRRGSQGAARCVLLKGPIYFLKDIDSLIFLCSPIFNNVDELKEANIFLADMNLHGLSRELVHQEWQHLSRLELLFEKAESNSKSLENARRLHDDWKEKGDQLLYSMIPKQLAEQLIAGKDPETLWQEYDSVTIMFVGMQISEAESRADVMETVKYMNDVYSRMDRLLDTHKVYKVETVGTVYMVVSGAPERRSDHADCVASAALAVSEAIPKLTIGLNSGPCQAGVLSSKRYCIVGDTVNTASRMQTTCEPGRIQITAATAQLLTPERFRFSKRGPIKVKGKGVMVTYWLEEEN